MEIIICDKCEERVPEGQGCIIDITFPDKEDESSPFLVNKRIDLCDECVSKYPDLIKVHD